MTAPQTSTDSTAGAAILHFPQREHLLHTVMENAAVGMILVGNSGRVTYANRAYAEMFGCPPSECVGLEVAALVHPDDRALTVEQFSRLIRGEIDQYRVERRYVRKDGSTFWGLASASLLRHEHTGSPFYTVVQITDIDRQKRAEAALAESESRWNFALEGAGQGVWDHDLKNKRAFFSRTWKVMRGFDPDAEVDPSQKAWLARVHPDDRERILEEVRRQDSGEQRYNAFEYRERHQDGHWIWILSRGKPVEWLPDGSPARIIGTDTDITGLKMVQGALSEERERLRVTLQSIADGVISTDADGRITFINPIAEQMTGWSASEAIGLRIEDVFTLSHEDGRPAANPVSECLSGRILRHVAEDAVLVTRTGRRRDLRSSVALLNAADRTVFGAVLVFQDVTRSRALQRELAHSAMHDSLTGLGNRSAFEEKLREVAAQACAEQREHALCFIDLDRFKGVNDGAGHAAGDAMLCRVARAIKEQSRRRDFAARVGGDEFALILTDCSLESARRIAEGIVDAITRIRLTRRGQTYQVGVSIGVTKITDRSPRAAEVMNEADAACYAAKASGGNRVSTYDEARSAELEAAEPG
jgi:diguanylate cyclase (GGDEF)-like protein/PAS domain S-box-containing protein